MSYSIDTSPVGWYIATYQLRFIELDDKRNFAPHRRFTVWENTVVVQAKTMEAAYRKVVKIGKECTKPYKGGPQGIDVQWLFEGVIELLPIYEEIKDGAELMWGERVRTLQAIRKSAKRNSADFKQDTSSTKRSKKGRTKRVSTRWHVVY